MTMTMTEQGSGLALDETFKAFNQERAKADEECKTFEDFRQRMAEAASKLPMVRLGSLDADRRAKVAVILTAFARGVKTAIIKVGDHPCGEPCHAVLVNDCVHVSIDGVMLPHGLRVH